MPCASSPGNGSTSEDIIDLNDNIIISMMTRKPTPPTGGRPVRMIDVDSKPITRRTAVAEAVVETYPVPVCRWGLQDVFGESGSPKELYAKFQIDAAGIANRAAAFVRETRHD